MSNGIELNWGVCREADGSELSREARLRLFDQAQPERSRTTSETQQDKSPETAQARKDAEDIARSNPPDKDAVETLAEHLFASYLEGKDNWSGQVEYAGKVNEALKQAGSKLRVVINSATRAFKNEVGPGEIGLFSIVDTDGNVIVSNAEY